MSWNIGANDVANAMGTSVGSGALTFRKAIILAAIFEFCGAFFMGGHVAETISKGIVPIDAFLAADHRGETSDSVAPGLQAASDKLVSPELKRADGQSEDLSTGSMEFGLGMLSALVAAALWLNVATFFGQPVSTTHAIVGAVVGFAITSRGFASPNWLKLGEISMSWVVSPVIGGVTAFLIYRAIQRYVLHARHPVLMAKRAVPLGMAAVVCILTLSILYKVLKIHKVSEGVHPPVSPGQALALSVGIGLAVGIFAIAVIVRRTRDRYYPLRQRYQAVERWFGRLQVMTACYMAFAHGANDVANAIGPVAAAVNIFAGGTIVATARVPDWLLILGGLGIMIGLATYGYKIIDAVGRKITDITPTRGFSAEFATATTVLVCSRMGWPISTTFVLVGAVMGVGVARGFAAIDMKVIKRIFVSWVITIPICAVFAGLIFQALRAIVL
ncbi:MAG: anion permease [Phycisphaerae bacterium]|nr:anion permease [Phycisphaerae bacterium]